MASFPRSTKLPCSILVANSISNTRQYHAGFKFRVSRILGHNLFDCTMVVKYPPRTKALSPALIFSYIAIGTALTNRRKHLAPPTMMMRSSYCMYCRRFGVRKGLVVGVLLLLLVDVIWVGSAGLTRVST